MSNLIHNTFDHMAPKHGLSYYYSYLCELDSRSRAAEGSWNRSWFGSAGRSGHSLRTSGSWMRSGRGRFRTFCTFE